jgi:hypothetical protein
MRRSSLFLLTVGSGLLALAALVVLGAVAGGRTDHSSEALAREVAMELRITDPCLFTEARYTRHLTLADFHAPLQEHPLSLEHFPSGSLARPPLALRSATVFREPEGGQARP